MGATLLADNQLRLRAEAVISDIPDQSLPRSMFSAEQRGSTQAPRRSGLLPLQIGLGATVGLAIAGIVTFTVIGNVVAPPPEEAAEAAPLVAVADPVEAASDVRIIDPVAPPPVEIEAVARSSAAVFGESGTGDDVLAQTPGVVLVGGEQVMMTPNGAAGQAVVVSAVNMRSAPQSGSAVLTVVPAGAVVGLFGCDYWCQVSYAGQTGYIYQDFLSLPR